MSKNILILVGVLLVVGVLVVILAPQPQPSEQREAVTLEAGLEPIVLSQDEKQMLLQEGFSLLPEGADDAAQNLQSVRSSDELDAIEADLDETNLSGLDAELEAIEEDLSGL